MKSYRITFFGQLCLILGTIILLANCSNDTTLTKSNPPLFNSLLGEWEWVKSLGPWRPGVITPKTEGYSLSSKFKSDNTVEEYKDNKLVKSYPFKLRYRINDIINPKSDSTIVLVINNGTESFFSIKNDTLVIDQSYIDGPTSFYTRKK